MATRAAHETKQGPPGMPIGAGCERRGRARRCTARVTKGRQMARCARSSRRRRPGTRIAERATMRKLVLDPGHGGDASVDGSSSRGVRGPSGTLEKDVTLALARRLRAHLEPGVSVALTRDRDVNVTLAERAALARREGADAFLSLHANGGRRGGQGAETWVHPDASPSARALAGRVQGALAGLGRPSRGVKVAALGVIDPARLGGADGCLLEVDFLSDAQGERRLR